MKLIILISLIFFLNNCSKPKTVMICGDHICINKSEAEQYFEENLTLEVKIVDYKVKNEINLVELNLKESVRGEKEIRISSKNKTNRNLKNLSSEKIIDNKKKKKKRKKDKKIAKKISENNNENSSKLTRNKIIKKENLNSLDSISKRRNVNKTRDVIDVCTILDKCNIDEISKYLLDQGKNKDFPDISTKE